MTKNFLNAALIIAGVVAAAPAWAQPPAISYSFNSAGAAGSGTSVPPATSRAPGADALRWLGGLGPIQAEPTPDGTIAGRSVAHH
jgi:hypothetical protein